MDQLAIVTAKPNDLLLNYVQAYVNWLAHPDSELAFEDNQLMVSIQNEFNRREDLRKQLLKQLNECMDQLGFTGEEKPEKD